MERANSTLLNKLFFMRKDRSGNVSLFIALTLFLVLIAIGAAIDTAGVASERSRLQDITDSAALAAAATGEDDENELNEIVAAIMKGHEDPLREFTYKLTINPDDLIVSAFADYETQFMKIFGRAIIPISAESGAPNVADMSVHLALVVDTTDSMAGDNLSSLQDAATELVDILKEQDNDGATQMSVVPFGSYVNVGMGNRNAAWMDVPNDFTRTPDCYQSTPVKSRTNCRTITETRYRDGVPYDYDKEVCDIEYEDFEVEVCPSEQDVEWNGCAGSREAPLNIQAPAARGSTEIPGAMGESCGSPVLPMTDDFGDVQDAIDDLTTRGDTYLAPGLLWGWRTLTGEAPYANASLEPDTNRALIFMTDGGNTMRPYDKYDEDIDSYHRSYNPDEDAYHDAAIDRMLATCSGIKDEGITIYTIGYKVPDGAVNSDGALLACASSTSNFYSADSAKELKEVFKDIAKSLSVVRLKF